jgi:hypothetical protein
MIHPRLMYFVTASYEATHHSNNWHHHGPNLQIGKPGQGVDGMGRKMRSSQGKLWTLNILASI